jgi:hypothetical protein
MSNAWVVIETYSGNPKTPKSVFPKILSSNAMRRFIAVVALVLVVFNANVATGLLRKDKAQSNRVLQQTAASTHKPEPIHIPLERHIHPEAESILLQLKMRQQKASLDFSSSTSFSLLQTSQSTSRSSLRSYRARRSAVASASASASSVSTASGHKEKKDEPLEQEVLREKHLATYYGNVQIGSTRFRVLMDTGSVEFWVPSSQCTVCDSFCSFFFFSSFFCFLPPNCRFP